MANSVALIKFNFVEKSICVHISGISGIGENVATRHVTSLFFQKKQGFRNVKNRNIRENRGIVTKFTGRS